MNDQDKRAIAAACMLAALADGREDESELGALRRALLRVKDEGLDLDSYIHRGRPRDEVLPWAHIDNGMKPELLERQYEKALSSTAPALSIA